MEIYGLTREQIRVAASNANVVAFVAGYTKTSVKLAGESDEYPGIIVRLHNEPDNVSGAKGKKAWASHSGRLSRTTGRYRGKAGVCWHGHYKFILEVFKLNANARVSSRMMVGHDSGLDFNVPPDVYSKWGKITYDGIGNFSKYAHETGAITYQQGWNGRPRLTLRDTCYCEQHDDGVYQRLTLEATALYAVTQRKAS